MNKLEIQQLLTHHKVSSISDIICFVIQQVNKTLSNQPIESICARLNELEKAKGLDVVMIEEVKTICEAMIDQREETLRDDFDKTLNEHWEHIQRTLTANAQNTKNNRQSLAEIDMLNFLNTNSFNTGFHDDTKKSAFQDQFRKNRDSFKDIFSKQLTRDNLISDCDRLKESIQTQRKQVNDLKYSLMQINREISNKITIEQAHSIISEFQSRMYHKIQNQKLELQRLEFSIKKELQQEILKVRKETFVDFDFETLKKDISALRKLSEKAQKKLEKYRQETKSLSKNLKNLEIQQKVLQKQLTQQKRQFREYSTSNDSKNQDLSVILEQINQKLSYFDKIDQLQSKVDSFGTQFAKAQWSTQCKTKNDSIVWEKQLANTNQQMFKFETQKSQIVINEPGHYLVEFTLVDSKSSLSSGTITVQSLSVESSRKEIKAVGSNSLKFIAQVQEKSLLWLKLGGQNSGSVGGKGILKISKY